MHLKNLPPLPRVVEGTVTRDELGRITVVVEHILVPVEYVDEILINLILALNLLLRQLFTRLQLLMPLLQGIQLMINP